MELAVLNESGQSDAKVTASDTLFRRDYNEVLVHQLLTAYRANARSVNRSQLTRAEVRHTTAKPYRQKGTGRARAGMVSSPLWRGGGRAFPNKPDENFSQKVNRKVYRAGIATILSQLVREDRLHVIDHFSVDAPKTRQVSEKLKGMGLSGASVLLIVDQLDERLYLAARNLPRILIREAHRADPLSLVRYDKVLITQTALEKLEGALA